MNCMLSGCKFLKKIKLPYWNFSAPYFFKKRGVGAKLSHKILSNLIKENNQSSN